MSSHGVVVDHKESGVRYAVSDKNFNEKVSTYVRDLKPGESTRTYIPKTRDFALAEDEADKPEDYSGSEWTVAALEAEIDARNDERDADSQLVPASGKKHDLIDLLLQDDNTPESGE